MYGLFNMRKEKEKKTFTFFGGPCNKIRKKWRIRNINTMPMHCGRTVHNALIVAVVKKIVIHGLEKKRQTENGSKLSSRYRWSGSLNVSCHFLDFASRRKNSPSLLPLSFSPYAAFA